MYLQLALVLGWSGWCSYLLEVILGSVGGGPGRGGEGRGWNEGPGAT